MSDETTTVTAATPTRNMETVNGKKTGTENQGALVIVKPAELAKAGTTGTVASGIYEGILPSELYPESPSFKIRADNGDLILVNSCGSLKSQMNRVNVGTYVELVYKGQDTIKSGPRKGKQAHSFIVLREEQSA
jgi:hypothetical protein